MSETKNLTGALVKARAMMTAPKKSAINSHFGSRYVPLDAIIDVAMPALAKHGLTVVQAPRSNDGKMYLRTTIVHESGEVMDCGDYLLAPLKPGPQPMGSEITYARRYALAAVLGLAAEDDDDGQAAQANGHGQSQSAPTPQPQAPPRPVNGLVRIPKVSSRTGEKDEKPWTRYYFKLGEVWYQTFSDTVGELLQRASESQEPVKLETQPNRRGDGLTVLGVFPAHEPADDIDLPDDDIPF